MLVWFIFFYISLLSFFLYIFLFFFVAIQAFYVIIINRVYFFEYWCRFKVTYQILRNIHVSSLFF
ncbi:MAG: hypothetical protein DSY58_07135 [Desulfobulbus sp.]|nr:MAG: hypothetical protein DSY58_07135 [Desulfobulbus sp.]RUM38284.1 MAG: hypothetical protein DSY70_08125 [Desulfobulbus sp.]